MKNFNCIILILMLLLSNVLTGIQPAKAATQEYLLYTDFSNESFTNSGTLGKYVITKMTGNYAEYNSYRFEKGIGGKEPEDPSLALETVNYDGSYSGTDPIGDPFIHYQLSDTEAIRNDFTAEFSLLGCSDICSNFADCTINGTMQSIIRMDSSHKLYAGKVAIGRWEKGRWYKFAISAKVGESFFSVYLNGAFAANVSVGTAIEKVSRIKIGTTARDNASISNPISNHTAMDDLKVYYGAYDKSKDAIDFRCDGLIHKEQCIYTDGSQTAEEVIASANTSRVRIYTDNTFTALASGVIRDGMLLTAYSENGETIQYYPLYCCPLQSSVYKTDFQNRRIENITRGTTAATVLTQFTFSDGFTAHIENGFGKTLDAADKVSGGMKLIVANSTLSYDFTLSEGTVFKQYFDINNLGTLKSGEDDIIYDAQRISCSITQSTYNSSQCLTAQTTGNTSLHSAIVKFQTDFPIHGAAVLDFCMKTESTAGCSIQLTGSNSDGNRQYTIASQDNITLSTSKDNRWHRYTFVISATQEGMLYTDGTETDSIPAIVLSELHEVCFSIASVDSTQLQCDSFQLYSIAAPESFEASAQNATLTSKIYTIDGDTIYYDKNSYHASQFRADLLLENAKANVQLLSPNKASEYNDTYITPGMIIRSYSPDKITVRDYTLQRKITETSNFLTEDFEDYPIGHFTKTSLWTLCEKEETGGLCEIVDDSGNKIFHGGVHYVENSEIIDSIIQTDTVTLNSKLYFSFKIKPGNDKSGNSDVVLRSAENGQNVTLSSLSGTQLKLLGGNYVQALSEEAIWYNVTLCIDPSDLSASAYLNGEKVVEVADYHSLNGTNKKDITSFYFRIQNFAKSDFGAKFDVYYDDFNISDNISLQGDLLFSGAPSVQTYNSKSTSESMEQYYKIKAFVQNNARVNQSFRVIAAYTKEKSIDAVFLSDCYTLSAGSSAIATMDVATATPLLDGKLKLFLMEDTTSMQPLSKATNFQDTLREYEKPQLLALYYNSTLKESSAHPRVIATAEDFSRIKRLQTTDISLSKWCDGLLNNADTLISNLTFDVENQESKYYIGYKFITGERLLEISSRVLNDAFLLGFAYQMTGEAKYIDTLWRIYERAGYRENANSDLQEFPDWHPKHFLDTAQMTLGFAIGYDWCYDAFTLEQREYIAHSIMKYGLEPAYGAYTEKNSYSFRYATNNWNGVCAGNIGVGALAVADYCPQLSFSLLSECISDLRCSMQGYAPDGGWTEGISYWNGQTINAVRLLQTEKNYLGTDFGFSDISGFDKTGYFTQQNNGPCGSNNYSDSGVIRTPYPVMFWFAQRFNNSSYAAGRLQYLSDSPSAVQVEDCLWYKPALSSGSLILKNNELFSTIGLFMLRSGTGDTDSFFSAHAGKVTDSHSHVDCSTFVYDYNGNRWACDLGAEYYYDNYFSAARYNYYRVRAEGHNVVVINPDNTPGQDLNGVSKICCFDDSPCNPHAIIDLQNCYQTATNSYKRGFMLGDSNVLYIRDELSLKQDNSTIYWFMHTEATELMQEADGYYLFLNGEKMKLDIYTNAEILKCELTDAAPLPQIDNDYDATDYVYPIAQDSNTGIHKIMLKLKGSGECTVSVALIPEGTKSAPLIEIPLKAW